MLLIFRFRFIYNWRLISNFLLCPVSLEKVHHMCKINFVNDVWDYVVSEAVSCFYYSLSKSPNEAAGNNCLKVCCGFR